MAGTYTQIHIQLVFAVKYRQRFIQKSWKEDLYKYMATIIQNNGHKVLQINGVEDHIHILIGYRPVKSLSFLMQELKRDSSKWINERRLCPKRFAWQEGYGAFSYRKSDVPGIIRYIQNQEEHHRKKDFKSEYKKLLEEFDINYDEYFLFKDVLI
jgi:REP element-mobilizing transposase RayT